MQYADLSEREARGRTTDLKPRVQGQGRPRPRRRVLGHPSTGSGQLHQGGQRRCGARSGAPLRLARHHHRPSQRSLSAASDGSPALTGVDLGHCQAMSDIGGHGATKLDPDSLPKAAFRGGIRRRPLGSGVSYPFGHLEFDAQRLRIWGFGESVEVRRSDVEGVRLSTGILATRVAVVGRDGAESDVYFAALRRSPVRKALNERGWPVVESRFSRRP